ncbi:uncharacterized protein SETTUDRAFT_32668 [Exserohilum turcica Et28A]|uniref:Uncharacterized protein n=1 Tax=Exserohilum turcicum (strain 28A) TaxID=671987 RepID=R0JWZ9_EXST2|nr:uncharacterized protein SETTUDRAFT_32668 [Exserohilum turcica Et28A]EOA85468.1 hypothetical protein SETTUDRAFT_32668 [Exserohilum turcica Et28A]
MLLHGVGLADAGGTREVATSDLITAVGDAIGRACIHGDAALAAADQGPPRPSSPPRPIVHVHASLFQTAAVDESMPVHARVQVYYTVDGGRGRAIGLRLIVGLAAMSAAVL